MPVTAKLIIHAEYKGSETSGNWGHAGRPGEVGGSGSDKVARLPTDIIVPDIYVDLTKPPKLPGELQNATGWVTLARQQLRAQLMHQAFPDAEFSLQQSNPLGVAAGKKAGIIGGLPRAIMPRMPSVQEVADDNVIKRMLIAYKANRTDYVIPYATYTSIKLAAKLTFSALFGAIKHLWLRNPIFTVATVDRSGKNTAIKLIDWLNEYGVK